MKRLCLMSLLIFLPFTAYAGSTIKISVAQTKPDGRAWDVLNGAPDPYIKIDGKSYRLDRCQNSFTCKFYTDETISEPVSIEVWDADASIDDSAGSTFCVLNQECSTGSASIIIY